MPITTIVPQGTSTAIEDIKKSKKQKEEELENSLHKCDGCGGTYFSEEVVRRYQKAFTPVVGQKTPAHSSSIEIPILRCVFCGALKIPQALRVGIVESNFQYDKFLDALDAYKNSLPKAG
jgi:hypothetical protein